MKFRTVNLNGYNETSCDFSLVGDILRQGFRAGEVFTDYLTEIVSPALDEVNHYAKVADMNKITIRFVASGRCDISAFASAFANVMTKNKDVNGKFSVGSHDFKKNRQKGKVAEVVLIKDE